MHSTHIDTTHLPVDLGDGLLLRRSTGQDAESLADFNARIQSESGPDSPDMRLWHWTYDLCARPHPTFSPADFTIVEETVSHRIVSTMNLIPQTWTYAGIPFRVGRPELVGTLPEYRHRGLVRLQFDVVHRWSAERGYILQVITGIPYYYRLFGYEMAMNLGGGRVGFPMLIPRLKEGEDEPYHIRPATEADIPFLVQVYALGCKRSLVACEWDASLWRYELLGRSKENVNRVEVRIIEAKDGQPCGYFLHPHYTWGEAMPAQYYELMPGFPWLEVTPSVIRYLEKAHAQVQPDHGEKKPFAAFGFWLGEDHPLYHVMPDRMPRIRKPYAWYLRLPDIPGFLKLITPVLEQRLSASALAGYSGDVKVTFYRDGLHLVFQKGRLVTVESWQPTPVGNSGNAGFPPHTFLQLLFGYRTMEMLKNSFVDCWTDRDEIHMLLDALFPRQPSDVWPVS